MKKIILTFVLAFIMCFAISSCGSYEIAVEQPTTKVVVSTRPIYYYYGRYYYAPQRIYRRSTQPLPPKRYTIPTPPPKRNVGDYRPPQTTFGKHRH